MALTITSEGPARITKATVERAWKQRGANCRHIIRDLECRGLALVVNPSSMAWVYSYKPRGMDTLTGRRFATRSVNIGTPASHSPEEARAEANRLKAGITSGTDPVQDRKAKHAATAKRLSATVARLAVLYAKALPKRTKMRGGEGAPSARYVKAELASLHAAILDMKAGAKAAADLTVADFRKLVEVAPKGAVAKHRWGAASRFMDWCVDEGHAPLNPAHKLGKDKRPRAPKARTDFLTPDQIAVVWKAAERMAFPVHRDFVRVLLALPCRRGEAAAMDWAHLDLDAGTWDQPDRTTKNGDPHRLHLHALALDLLRERHRAVGEPRKGLVFPGPKAGKPLATFAAMKREIDALAGMTGWQMHDLRRSFATALGEAGISEAVADATLNHRQSATRGGVMGVYQLSVQWPDRRRAMDAWGAMLAAAINPPDQSNVTPLHGTGGGR